MMSIEEKLSRILVASAAAAGETMRGDFLEKCGSQIEMLMAVGLWSRGVWTTRALLSEKTTIEGLKKEIRGKAGKFDVMPVAIGQQVQVEKYRLDFLLVGEGFETGMFYMLAVECDGHDFHEKTKEQAARDKSRDRTMSSMGITTMRFTGSEIWADAGKCADEALTFFHRKWEAEYDTFFRNECNQKRKELAEGRTYDQQQ